MKIAIFHELHSGGARRSVNEFAKRLKKNHIVDLYFVDELKNDNEKTFFSNVNYYKFIPKKWTGNDWKTKLYKDTIELIKLYILHKKIAIEIDSKKYDIVFIDPSRFTQAPFILRFLKTKKIYYCQEPLRMVYEEVFDIKKDLHPLKFLYEKLNRLIRKKIDNKNIKYADLIIANSKYTQSNIMKSYGLKSTFSYMGVDTQVFKPVEIKKDIDILFIGAFEFSDGYNLFENAKKFLKSKANIKILASEKQWISNDLMIRNLYCRSRLVLALAFNEPFGLIPIEAMACGVPVVAVNEGGYKETIIDGETGFLVSRNPKILAQKLDFLLTHQLILQKTGDNARRKVTSRWTWEKSTNKLENILLKHNSPSDSYPRLTNF